VEDKVSNAEDRFVALRAGLPDAEEGLGRASQASPQTGLKGTDDFSGMSGI